RPAPQPGRRSSTSCAQRNAFSPATLSAVADRMPAMASRDDSDEAYVVGLCNQVLGEQALTQHKFDWLLGDPGAGGRQVRLPVDAYWPGHRLVVEYRVLQHDQPVPHFDKTVRLTVSGVHSGEQWSL